MPQGGLVALVTKNKSSDGNVNMEVSIAILTISKPSPLLVVLVRPLMSSEWNILGFANGRWMSPPLRRKARGMRSPLLAQG